MHHTHRVFKTPPDEKVIWKYLSFSKFVYLIEKQALLFTKLRIQDDKREGLDSAYAIHSKYISCWHMNDHENMAMWNNYSGSDGIAIKTTVGDLRRSIENDPVTTFFCEVEYKSEEEISKLDLKSNLYLPVIYKTLPYAYENEVRMCISSPSNDNPISPETKELFPDIPVYIDLSTLLKEIVISPYCKNWVHLLVVSYLKNREIFPASVTPSTIAIKE
ncbi:MAG: DUF2971 domain-containing protein [Chlorobium sp.]|nr:DUF2971 domain-containing protein [Chlorobium sp.]